MECAASLVNVWPFTSRHVHVKVHDHVILNGIIRPLVTNTGRQKVREIATMTLFSARLAAHARADAITFPLLISRAMASGATPTDASMVWPNDARLSTAATSPLGEALPVFESIASAP